MSDQNLILLEDLLVCLLECSEKAARIARIFRREDELFGFLVEEKAEIEKNRILVQDYKTLADVLVQETIKRDVGRKFPILSSKIQGEEQNSFENTLGESIKVELTDSSEETASLLCKVLNGRVHIAESLAATVHSDDLSFSKEFTSSISIPADRLGIWIDPIDSTAEYIQAKEEKVHEYDIVLYGLKCVCVLIGVYDLQTGIPVMGIINQPFYKRSSSSSKWESNVYWGISYESVNETSATIKTKLKDRRKVLLISSFENKDLVEIMKSKYVVIHAAGAGYKCILVALKAADMYVLSLQNTHFWDTCGPHAILSAEGGGIVSFNQIVKSEEILNSSNILNYHLKYLDDPANQEFRNIGGVIAYKDPDDLIEFLHLLKEKEFKSS